MNFEIYPTMSFTEQPMTPCIKRILPLSKQSHLEIENVVRMLRGLSVAAGFSKHLRYH